MNMAEISQNLEQAIRTNDLILLKKALKCGSDINSQDKNGNTTFHLAIRSEVTGDIIKELLLNGADVNVENKQGLSPVGLAMAKGSDDIIVKLFQLRDYIHYEDSAENTLLHVLMKVKNINKSLMESINKYPTDINIQNKYGSTPVHETGGYLSNTFNQLKHLLNSYDHFDPFIRDNGGDTFLHSCFNGLAMEESDIEIVEYLTNGMYKHLSTDVVKRLLTSKNNIGDTPFSLLAMNDYITENPDVSLDIIQKCLSAGADINCTNNLGESPLHFIIQKARSEFGWSKNDERVLHFFLQNGADINLQNKFGYSPLFQCWNCECRSTLLEYVPDVNIRDKSGRTPLMGVFMYTPSVEEIKKLIDKGADINGNDFHGSSPLHIAVWHEIEPSVLRFMVENGARISQDKLGQFPQDIARQLHNEEIVVALSENDPNFPTPREDFKFPTHVVDYELLVKGDFTQIEYITNCLKLDSDVSVDNLLNMPYIGKVCFDEEADQIKSNVFNFVKEICIRIASQENMFSNTVIQSGSVGEGTKICFPDEFDFVCILDNFEHICKIDEDTKEPGVASLKLSKVVEDQNILWFFDKQGRLNVQAVRLRFCQLFKEALYDSTIWTCPNLSLHFETNYDVDDQEVLPTCRFSIHWVGPRYKDLNIDVDLVPACRIRNWWPENINRQKLPATDDGSLLLFQCKEITFHQHDTKMRISALPAEQKMMKTISRTAFDGYIFAKLLCTDWVVKRINFSKRSVFKVGDLISSYMLKNCVFHLFGHAKDNKAEDVKSFTIAIFKLLLSHSLDGNLPGYFVHFNNIFTFDNPNSTDQHRRESKYRSVFAKLILSILGEKQEFMDISDEDLIDNINSDELSSSESDSEDNL